MILSRKPFWLILNIIKCSFRHLFLTPNCNKSTQVMRCIKHFQFNKTLFIYLFKLVVFSNLIRKLKIYFVWYGQNWHLCCNFQRVHTFSLKSFNTINHCYTESKRIKTNNHRQHCAQLIRYYRRQINVRVYLKNLYILNVWVNNSYAVVFIYMFDVHVAIPI